MKRTLILVFAAVLGGAITLGSYKLLFDDQNTFTESTVPTEAPTVSQTHLTYVTNSGSNAKINLPDFTEAAQKTVKAVVHVKNMEIVDAPRNISDYLRGIRGGKYVRGMGSGVVITPDGYIVTNNHVIEGANELEVTLTNNKTYKAKVMGVDPKEDIALLKIDAKDLDYLPFGNSDNTQIGQWVLAVGNPFNLTSTVTAGIISAKGRNLNPNSASMQSYIQTDAAINPGNSGGALVNAKGELIGINAAITSKTGSYIGYSFAIPSNNARKIVEDILEYGNVKHAILGVRGNTINSDQAKDLGILRSQGVLVNSASDGAEKAGLKKGDLITKVDARKVREMSDLSSYIATKRPGDKVEITYIREGKKHTTQANLTEYKTYILKTSSQDFQIFNTDKELMKYFDSDHGVGFSIINSESDLRLNNRVIIVAIDGNPVSNVDDVQKIMENKSPGSPTKITFLGIKGYTETDTF